MGSRIQEAKERLLRTWDGVCERTGYCYVADPLLHPASNRVVTLDVPGYLQLETYTCGFVAGLMVLHSLYPKRSVDQFFRRCRPHPEYGMGIQKLTTALRKSGLGVSQRSAMTFHDIKTAIDEGFPIITCVSTRHEVVDHWVVIYGYGVEPDEVLIAGNGFSWLRNKKRHSYEDFESKLWSPPGFGLVCWGKS